MQCLPGMKRKMLHYCLLLPESYLVLCFIWWSISMHNSWVQDFNSLLFLTVWKQNRRGAVSWEGSSHICIPRMRSGQWWMRTCGTTPAEISAVIFFSFNYFYFSKSAFPFMHLIPLSLQLFTINLHFTSLPLFLYFRSTWKWPTGGKMARRQMK